MTIKTFNEMRDFQHSIARKRDSMVKVKLQTTDNNRKKHSFLYGYTPSKENCDSRLVGSKEDVILIESSSQQEQAGPILTKKLTPPRNQGNK